MSRTTKPEDVSIGAQVRRYLDAWDLSDPNSYDVPCAIVGGARGSGKSTFMLGYYVIPMLWARGYQCVVSPGISTGIECAAQALFHGHKETLIVDNLGETIGLGIPIIRRDDSPDQDIRDSLNDRYASRFTEGVCRMFVGDPDTLITLDECGTLCANLWQSFPDPLPQMWVFDGIKPWTKNFRTMRDHCTCESVKDKADQLARKYDRSYTEFLKTTQATLRRMDRLERCPGIVNRQWDGTPHLKHAITSGGMLCLLIDKGGKTPIAAQRFLAVTCKGWHIDYESELWSVNGCPTPLQFVDDEAFGNLLVGNQEITSAEEQRKFGVNHVWGGPYPTTGDEFLDARLWGVADEQIGLRMNSYAAAEMFVRNRMEIDPTRVKRVIERTQRIVDGYDRIDTTSKGRSRDHDGHERTDERRGDSFRPRYVDRTESQEDLYQFDEQLKLSIRDQLRFPKGVFGRKLYDTITVPMYQAVPEDVWSGAGPELVAEHIEWLRNEQILRKAVSDFTPSMAASPTATERSARRSAARQSSTSSASTPARPSNSPNPGASNQPNGRPRKNAHRNGSGTIGNNSG
jgi:hypothetical protein